MPQQEQINIEETICRTYISNSGRINYESINRLLADRHLFTEGVAMYVGKITYPEHLGGLADVIHMNETTVNLSYNPKRSNISEFISIYGREQKIEETKQLLARSLGF